MFPCPPHLPCCGPKPQTTAKLAPHNVVAQRFDWFCHLCAWARCAGAARWDTRGETAVECAKCPTSQIWGPNQVPCNGRWKAPWCLAMCWWPNRLVVCKFQGLGGQGWAILCLQMWRSCRPGLQKCPNPTKSQPKWANGAPELHARLVHYFPKMVPKKHFAAACGHCGKPCWETCQSRATWPKTCRVRVTDSD